MEIKPATRTKLGAIIVGDDFKITDDGILTLDEKKIQQDNYVEFTRTRLENLFEQSKSRRR